MKAGFIFIPDPTWRDNLLMNLGQFDEDQMWSDTIGGLFEGYPYSEIEPWNIEVSLYGFPRGI